MGKFIQKELLGFNFVGDEFLAESENEYTIRNRQLDDFYTFRKLNAEEISHLIVNNNTADNWGNILVTDGFDSHKVLNCDFFGLVRIGDLDDGYLEHNDLQLPVGLYNSKIISCDFGNNVSIENVNYLSHYQIGDESILFNINEMTCCSHAKFGNGILKEGEEESTRVWLELCNENGGRGVSPFEGMLSGDAYLWSKYRDDKSLMAKFLNFTENRYDNARGYYGTVGKGSTIKHCRIVKDVKIGEYTYIKGANKLKNLTINSSETDSTQIGEGVELVNGIIGYGCSIFYGVKAIRFILGNNSSLKYGARLINSFLGDNSTISCCEVLNALIFPGHEQHHNNSFLCAAIIMGQSNIAAAATIGSNHNSRANDGEIVAGRGFWPGLAVSLKHNSKFASFTLISKGSYPAELDIKIPFSLVTNDESEGSLKILPGFWFLYDMYALARNSWKYAARDKRNQRIQTLEFDYLAPDTVNETLQALNLLEKWIGGSLLNQDATDKKKLGRAFLKERNKDDKLRVFATNIESSKRKVEIIKPFEGYEALSELVILYATKKIVEYCIDKKLMKWIDIKSELQGDKISEWLNIGGQLMRTIDVVELKKEISTGRINSWEDVHDHYEVLGQLYPFHKAQHAFASLSLFLSRQGITLNKEVFISSLEKGILINEKLSKKTFESRNKDYKNPFRKMVYDTDEEMGAVVGEIEDNAFVKQTYKETKDLNKKVIRLIESLTFENN